MSFEEEFDKIIRQKSEEASFPFDEKNWQKMSGHLDAQKRPAGLWVTRKVFIGALAFFLISLSAYLIVRKTPVDPKTLATQEDDLKKAENNLSPALENNSSAKTIAQTNNFSSSIKNQAANNETKDRVRVTNESEISADDQQVEKKTPSSSEQKKSLNQQTNKNGFTEFSAKRKTKKKSSGSSAAAEVPAIPNVSVEQTANLNGKADKNSQNPNNKNDLTIVHNDNALNETDLPTPADDFTAEKTLRPDLFEAASMQTILTNLPQDERDQSLLPTRFVRLAYLDEDYYKKKHFKKHYLNLEAGTIYLLGWQSNKITDGKGFNWFAGLNYGRYLSQKISISAGAQIYNIAHIKNPFYSHSNTEFGFGATSTNTVITANTLYFLAVPVKFAYAVNADNQVGIGVNVGFLMAASKNVETFTYSENGKTNISNDQGIGAYKNIAGTNLSLNAFYTTKLTNRLALNGEITVGLTDLFKNTVKITNSEKATGIRVSLQYTLFDK